nr:MAG TPA: hypothetical protein [Caudoviricetes sp.]
MPFTPTSRTVFSALLSLCLSMAIKPNVRTQKSPST